MADAQEQIGQIVLTAGMTSVTFSNIPQGYKHLQLIAKIANSGSSSAGRLRFNNDSSASYAGVWMGGQSSYASGSESGATGSRVIGFSMGPTTGWSSFTLNVADYKATNKFKMALSSFCDPAGDVMTTATNYSSLSPVNAITIYDVLGQSYVDGSVFTLYGIVG